MAGDADRLFGLIQGVKAWAKEKGILDEATAWAQADKTMEEARELRDAVSAGDADAIKDGIGDTLVTLIIQAQMQGMSVTDCLDCAYEQIRSRTGQMIGGQFVKSEDLEGSS